MAEKNASRIEYAGRVLIDLTGDTVTAETLMEGATAHDRTGSAIVGIMKAPVYETWVFEMEDGSTVEKEVEVSA